MSTAAMSFEDFTRQLAATNPENALEVAIKATEAAREETARVKEESKLLASVKMGEHGYEAENLGGIYRLGQMYARSKLVPREFQGRPDDCAIVVQLAHRWGVDAFMAFQHVYPVYGKPGVDSQMAISLLHASGKIIGTVQYEFSGAVNSDDYGAVAMVRDKATGEIVRGPKVNWGLVKAEGWNKAKGDKQIASKWSTMPDLMFHYRSAMFLIRTHYPEVIMGLQSVEEIEDVTRSQSPQLSTPAASLSDLTAQLEAKAGTEPPDDLSETVNPFDAETAERIVQEASTAIKTAELIRDVEAIVAEHNASALPDLCKVAIQGEATTRIAEIRDSREPRSKKQAEPVESEPDPQVAESQSLMATCLDDLTRATEHGATAIENRALEARGTGDLLPEHCDIVTAACQKRLQTLDEQKRT